MMETSPEEAYKKFDEMSSRLAEQLRKLTKQVQEARHNHDDDGVKKAVNEYEETLERYVLYRVRHRHCFL
jgi:tetratricopeptide repeat protein 30